MKKTFQIVFSILLGFGWGFFGQSKAIAQQQEFVSFSTPKTLYFNGEKIWIDAEVNFSEGPSPSKILYVELIDSRSQSITHTMIPLEDGKALNYLIAPDQIPSAHYLLRVYTRMGPYLNLSTGVAQQFVTVINPLIPPQPIPDSLVYRAKWTDQDLSQVNSSKEILNLMTQSLGGQKISGGISLANPFLAQEQEFLPSSIYGELKKKNVLPELFGHILEVNVPEPDPLLTYFLSVHGKQSALYTSHPDELGRMYFDIGGLVHWDKVILQLEDGREMPGLEIVSPVIQTSFRPDFHFPQLGLREKDLEFLNFWLKASRVEMLYTSRYETDSVEIVTGFVADFIYDLDDYTRFEKVETIVREYVPSALVRMSNRKREFRLLNQANNSVFDSNPLILVDAMPVFDSDLLCEFNPNQLQKLEVLNREFYLNDRVYAGVLSFSSFDNNFGLFPLATNARFFDYLGVKPAVNLDRIQFGQRLSQRHIPDWRSILSWDKTFPDISNFELPAVEGVFMIWEKSMDLSGSISLQKKYFQLIN